MNTLKFEVSMEEANLLIATLKQVQAPDDIQALLAAKNEEMATVLKKPEQKFQKGYRFVSPLWQLDVVMAPAMKMAGTTQASVWLRAYHCRSLKASWMAFETLGFESGSQ